MKNLFTNLTFLGFLSILTIATMMTSCQKEAIVESNENIELADLETVINEATNNDEQAGERFRCETRIANAIVRALDNLIFELRRFACGRTQSSTLTQAFDIYVTSLENILGLPNGTVPSYVNANPNGGGCAFVSASGTLGAIYALDFLGCRIGTYSNNPTPANWSGVVSAFNNYINVLESVFGCNFNNAAYNSLLSNLINNC